MGTVTSITARPPRPPSSGGRGSLFAPDEGDSRLGTIMSVGNEELAIAVGLAVVSGMAIMFSPTSDGGAVGIHIWLGDKRDKRYATSAEELGRVLGSVRDIAEAKLAGIPGASYKTLQGGRTGS